MSQGANEGSEEGCAVSCLSTAILKTSPEFRELPPRNPNLAYL